MLIESHRPSGSFAPWAEWLGALGFNYRGTATHISLEMEWKRGSSAVWEPNLLVLYCSALTWAHTQALAVGTLQAGSLGPAAWPLAQPVGGRPS